MTVTLSPELEASIRAKIASGAYTSAEDLLASAIRALDIIEGRGRGETDAASSTDNSARKLSVERALAYYVTSLQSKLEPANNGKTVAIHPDSGDFEVRQRSGQAFRELRLRHAEGAIVLRNIGPGPESLVRRMRGERVA